MWYTTLSIFCEIEFLRQSPEDCSSPIMSSYAQFQEYYELYAQQERDSCDARPVLALLADVEAQRLGTYYQIWYSIGARAKPAEANSRLLAFLASTADSLHRYHCAAALIAVNQPILAGWQPQELSGHVYPVAQNLEKIRHLLIGV